MTLKQHIHSVILFSGHLFLIWITSLASLETALLIFPSSPSTMSSNMALPLVDPDQQGHWHLLLVVLATQNTLHIPHPLTFPFANIKRIFMSWWMFINIKCKLCSFLSRSCPFYWVFSLSPQQNLCFVSTPIVLQGVIYTLLYIIHSMYCNIIYFINILNHSWSPWTATFDGNCWVVFSLIKCSIMRYATEVRQVFLAERVILEQMAFREAQESQDVMESEERRVSVCKSAWRSLGESTTSNVPGKHSITALTSAKLW